ncbi:MAG TPA: citrate synthase [Gemmatimonadaceae bacterium]
MPKTGSTAPPAAAPKKDSAKPAAAGGRNAAKSVAATPSRNSAKPSAPPPSGNALEIEDSRTNKTYTIPVAEGAIRANELKKIKTDNADDTGLMSYDPAFMNTASCRSAITYIDGDKGILRYRGYPIEQLAENATFLEVAWLLRHGELPTQQEYDQFVHDITFHTYVHENMRKFLEGFRYDAHPMAILNSSIAGLASFYPSARNIFDETERNISIIRLLAKTPTIAAFSYRHVKGLPFVYPDNRLSYVENFLSMVARMSESKYEANPVFARALEILFILHADHEQNCSTSAVRGVGSSHVDPFSAVSAGVAALFGPLHGGANEQVLRMIKDIGSVKNVPKFIESVKSGAGGRLMGFGHRVYKSYDPRAKIVKKLADEVFNVVGVDKDLEIALELERIALADDYFVSRKLYPNVDFYTGLIYRSMAFPMDFFTVLFAIGRMPGWLAQWEEMLLDKEQKISRPRQIYIGAGERAYRSRLTKKQ